MASNCSRRRAQGRLRGRHAEGQTGEYHSLAPGDSSSSTTPVWTPLLPGNLANEDWSVSPSGMPHQIRPSATGTSGRPTLSPSPEEAWQKAVKRFKILKPLLENGSG